MKITKRIFELRMEKELRPNFFYFEVDKSIPIGREKEQLKLAVKEFLMTPLGIKFTENCGKFTWGDVFEVPNEILIKYGFSLLEPVNLNSETVNYDEEVIL